MSLSITYIKKKSNINSEVRGTRVISVFKKTFLDVFDSHSYFCSCEIEFITYTVRKLYEIK